jgi:hypothetical protein
MSGISREKNGKGNPIRLDPTSANFSFLAAHDPQLVRLTALAEQYFKDDPTTSLIKLRQYGDTLAQLVAAKAGLFRDTQEAQTDLLRRLRFERVVPDQVGNLFHHLRIVGNKATHENNGTHAEALSALKIRVRGQASGFIAPSARRKDFLRELSSRRLIQEPVCSQNSARVGFNR